MCNSKNKENDFDLTVELSISLTVNIPGLLSPPKTVFEIGVMTS